MGICQTLGAPGILHKTSPELTSQGALRAAHPAETHCLASVSFRQYFPQDDKCAANKRKQLPALSETRAFSWGYGRDWLVDAAPKTGALAGRKQEGTQGSHSTQIYLWLTWLLSPDAKFSDCPLPTRTQSLKRPTVKSRSF